MCSENSNSIMDFEKICRTCLCEGEMLSIFGKISKFEEETMANMLMSCTILQLSKNDGLPSQICTECITELKNAYKFVKKCEKSDEKLRKQFKNDKCKKSRPVRKSTRASKARTKRKENDDISVKDEDSDDEPLCKENKNHETIVNKNITDNVKDSNLIPKNEIKENDSDYDDFGMDDYDSDVVIKDEKNNELQEIPVNVQLNENSDSDSSDEKSKKKTRFKRSVDKIKKGPPYECKKCLMSFPTTKELLQHRREVQHPKGVYAKRLCKICNKLIAYRSMNNHLRTHTKEKPFVCELCGTRFSKSGNLKRHTLNTHATEKPYKCDQCDKSYTTFVFLKDHKRSHTGEKPFICNYCGKSFTQSSSLRTHVFTLHASKDSEKQEHRCTICQRTYTTERILKAHMQTHGTKTFLCQHCGRGFYKKAQLQAHSVIHTGLRPHVCKICEKTFKHYPNLKSHMLTHAGIKPYKCKHCDKAFTQWTHLRYHEKTHTGEKPYRCTFCEKCFASNGNLTVHMRIHTGETPYICNICNKGFYDSSSMKKHRKGHPEAMYE